MKKESSKFSPRYSIAKLLLNSLYGRFGMNPDKPNHLFLKNENAKGMLNKNKDLFYLNNDVSNVIPFENGIELITYNRKVLDITNSLVPLEECEDNDNSNLFINVSIAAAITGYSRIFMSIFKNNPLFKLYYTDTDSAFIDKDLDKFYPELVGSELGKLKLEYEFKEAVFLAPKVYGGITTEGKSIVKAKGVKNIIPFDKLESLTIKDTKLQLPSEK
jgi:hypothetical protein